MVVVVSMLDYGRIFLSDQQDKLLWAHSNFVGSISAATSYDCITVNSFDSPVFSMEFLWTNCIPLKIACFNWLVAKDRILTWDQLQKKAFRGLADAFLHSVS